MLQVVTKDSMHIFFKKVLNSLRTHEARCRLDAILVKFKCIPNFKTIVFIEVIFKKRLKKIYCFCLELVIIEVDF